MVSIYFSPMEVKKHMSIATRVCSRSVYYLLLHSFKCNHLIELCVFCY